MGTAPTLEIAEIILRDSARIQEEEAEMANVHGYTRHHPAKALYNTADVEMTLPFFSDQPLDEWITLSDSVKVRFRYNGHIIGATFLELKVKDKFFVFSGDIGRPDDPLLFPPQKPDKADILLIETTYGNRLSDKGSIVVKLKNAINAALHDGGTIIIPSFAVERAQIIMYYLWQLQQNNEIPEIPIYLDSPMGNRVLGVFEKYPDWHKLSLSDCQDMCSKIRIVHSWDETKTILADTTPKIIIAGSGMLSGGRVLSYLQTYIEHPETNILLVGFQAEGTRGRQLLEGAHEIKIHGKYYPVKAQFEMIEGLSAHADQNELIDWLSNIANSPERVFLIHGESHASDTFRLKLYDSYHWQSEIPVLYDIVEFDL